MKRQFAHLAIGALIALGATHASADGYRRESPCCATDGWGGFYVGANVGAAWSHVDAQTVVGNNGGYFITTDPAQIAAAGAQRQNGTGFSGGVQAGYNWQISKFILGIETDFNSMRVRSSTSAGAQYLSAPGSSFTVTSSTDADWLFTLRPRIGYATAGWLVYGTGGLAVTDAHFNFRFADNFGPPPGARESASADTRVGWTVGGGVEFMLTRNWTVKAEYLFADFGKDSTTGVVSNTVGQVPATLAHEADLTTQIVRVGFNYKFGFEPRVPLK